MSRQPRKMDAPRALGMLGFKSSRALDQGTEDERRHMLDKQLFIRMQEIATNKPSGGSQPEDKEKNVAKFTRTSVNRQKGRDGAESKQSREEKIQESTGDVRMLHEAYQFLVKKYCPGGLPKKGRRDDQDSDAGHDDSNAIGMMMF